MFRSKCENCGNSAYIFPDQIQSIKKRSDLALSRYVKGKLRVGSPWFCIACDSAKKDARRCKIITELEGEKASKLIKIRKRETNLKSQGWILPSSN